LQGWLLWEEISGSWVLFCKMTDYVYEFDIVGFGVFDLEMTNG
jgi:hypothetical protein